MKLSRKISSVVDIRTRIVASLLVTAPPGASAAGVTCAMDAPEVREIRAIAEGIVAADNRSDIDAVLAYYAPDVVLMPPSEPPVVGRSPIRPR